MTGDMQPQDEDSGLVQREWVRRTRRRGELTWRTLVEATFLDERGGLHHAAGTVRRNDAGELVVESRADGIRRQTAVPRGASVTIRGR
jgi:hypothetical protein